MTTEAQNNERLLVLMPTPKDAEHTVAAMAQSNIAAMVCRDMDELCREIERGAGAALLTEEAIVQDRAGCLRGVLASQPSWSSFPLIVLAREGRRKIGLPEDVALHATLVERPLRMVTLKSEVETALRHRRRQYQLRGVLEDLERAKEELEGRVQERTAKLRELVAELEAFSYSVSHDLRAPLRAMNGYAEALLEEENNGLSERGRLYLERIHRAAKRLDLLVQDVLAYTKVSKGEIALRRVEVGPLLEDILGSYAALSEKATVEVEPPLPAVIAHEAYLSQCIANIIDNAIKFVPSGVRPHVRVWAETRDGGVRLNFQDNGIGIAPEHRDEIFRLFGRINPADAFGGTGLGLAIVKKAAERMGGSVGVDSEPSRGSRFWITLPRA